ncbi:MAG: NAD(P)H-binding protein [Frankiaceae bacterium]|nr:NAD(P)H-binding protein [Frankiaceae bacterium]
MAIGAAGLDTRLVGRVPPGDSTLRRIGHSALRLFTSNAAVRELAELAAAAQAPVTTGRRIAVVSVRGGAGRTATTALLGTVFAARRADHVLVADGDPEHGSLAWRLGLPGAGGLAPPLLAARALAEVDLVLPRTAPGVGRRARGAPGGGAGARGGPGGGRGAGGGGAPPAGGRAPHAERKDSVDRAGAVLLADAAEAAGVGRYVLLSSMGVEQVRDGATPDGMEDAFVTYLRAKLAAEDDVQARPFDWTVLRPGALTDDAGTGQVQLAPSVPRGEVPRDDVADVIAALLHDPATAGMVLELRSGDKAIVAAVAAAG